MKAKRVLSLVLAICLCLTMLPAMAPQAEAAAKLYWPLDTKWKITTGFTAYANHNGVDMAANQGSPIYANFDGTATYYQCYTTIGGTKYLTSYGNCVYLSSNDGTYWAVFGHMNAFEGFNLQIPSSQTKRQSGSSGKITIGTRTVRAGDIIGYVGTTGNSTGNHLHYGLKINGAFVNPENYLDRSMSARDASNSGTAHTVDPSYGTNFTAYPKAKITAENIFDANHNQINSTSWIGTSDQCTIHEVYTDGCCKVTYPLDKGGSKTVFSKISLFNVSNNPHGTLDVVEGGVYKVHVRGWAYDKDDLNAKLEIHVYVGGKGYGIIANTERPDVHNVFGCGNNHGFDATIDVDRNLTGSQKVEVYAINVGGGDNVLLGTATVNIGSDSKGPSISNVTVKDVTSSGYTVTCTVTDENGVNRVQFPSWTGKNGQDDLFANWQTNSAASGIKNGNTYSYRVDTSKHNHEGGEYITHIYAYDKYENQTCYEVPAVQVPIDVKSITLNKSEITFANGGLTYKLTAQVSPANATNQKITWTSSNTAVATVQDGVVKSVSSGTAVITATASNGVKATCTVTVKEVTLQSISVATKPNKTSYFVGGSLNTAGLTLKATYSDGSTKTITEGFTCTPTKLDTAGTQTITVSYGGKTATFTVSVIQIVAMTTISVETMPVKTTYFVGETLDTTGLTLKVTNSDGSTRIISGGFSCIPNKLTTAGTQSITIYYNSAITSFEVTVNPVTLTGIAVATNPTKTSYMAGETLDTTGLTLKATYSDGSTKTITEGFTCTPTKLDTAGTQTITVSYGGKTTSFKVKVNPRPEGAISVGKVSGTPGETVTVAIKLDSNPGIIAARLKIAYNSDVLTLTDVKDGGILGEYVFGGDKTANPYFVTWENGLAESDYTTTGTLVYLTFKIAENASSGELPITVTYEPEEIYNMDLTNVGFTITQGAVTITAKPVVTLTKIEVAKTPAKTVYEIGEALDTTGLTLTATYSDGSAETITIGFTISGFDSSTAGEKTVTVTYEGKSASFKVTVQKAEEVDPNAPQIVIDGQLVTGGQTITVEITAANMPNVKSLMIENFQYDSDMLEFVSAELNLENAFIADWDSTAMIATVAFTENADINGVIMTMTFNVKEDVEGECSITCDVHANQLQTSGIETQVELSIVPGTITVMSYERGDVNGDGYVNSNDAIYLLRYTLSPNRYPINQSGDMNGDGYVNSNDAIYLLRHTLSPARYPLY